MATHKKRRCVRGHDTSAPDSRDGSGSCVRCKAVDKRERMARQKAMRAGYSTRGKGPDRPVAYGGEGENEWHQYENGDVMFYTAGSFFTKAEVDAGVVEASGYEMTP